MEPALPLSGGHRKGIVDEDATIREQEVIFKDENYNEFKFKDYFQVRSRRSHIK
ncbi:MAG: hypothetical protein IPH57_00165 [Saprospiraceae bacterium]|nr:hypothetical protein [Saprospiraceae bacterium]